MSTRTSGSGEVIVGDIDHAELRQLHRYWLSKCGSRAQPSRSDLDPVEIPALLPNVMLVDVLDQGRKFRLRLVGTALAQGTDPTGRLLHEAAPKGLYGHHINALYAEAARLALPYYTQFAYGFAIRGGPPLIHRIFLPLSDDGARIDMLLIGQFAESPKTIEYSPWQIPLETFRAERLVIVEPGAL